MDRQCRWEHNQRRKQPLHTWTRIQQGQKALGLLLHLQLANNNNDKEVRRGTVGVEDKDMMKEVIPVGLLVTAGVRA